MALSSDQGGRWRSASWPGPDVYAVLMKFTDSLNGWVEGRDDSNRVVHLHSSDGGRNWSVVDLRAKP